MTRNVPACSLVVGIPARVQREDVSWTRNPDPSAEDISDMLSTVRPKASLGGLLRHFFPRAQKAPAEDEPV